MADSDDLFQLTDRFLAQVRHQRAAGKTQREMCALADLNESTFSELLHRRIRVYPDDQRIKRIAKIIGLTYEESVEPVPFVWATRHVA